MVMLIKNQLKELLILYISKNLNNSSKLLPNQQNLFVIKNDEDIFLLTGKYLQTVNKRIYFFSDNNIEIVPETNLIFNKVINYNI
jgi:hypothetical protein